MGIRGLSLTIRFDEKALHTVENKIRKTITHLPREGSFAMRDLTRLYNVAMLEEAIAAGITEDTGRSFGSIRRQISNPRVIDVDQYGTTYGIFLPNNLISLSEGWNGKKFKQIPLIQRMNIVRSGWAERHGFKTGKGRWITVHTHPFIDNATNRASSRISIVRNRISGEMEKIWR